MDDVWDTKVWDDVKRFFPDDINGSRVVLTTRLINVGVHAASSHHLHDMRFLSDSESWNLLCEKVFKEKCCPPCLEGVGWNIVRKCRGLPLSMVVAGGLISMNKITSYWETMAATLNSILAADGRQYSAIFSLSYNRLPAHLKPCFLYFAIFPEDYDIQRSKLIMLWVAEGFIKQNESKSLEDIAKEYLEDLLNRSLIMVSKLGYGGKVKTYRIHDLLRDFCSTEAQKEKFLHVANSYTPTPPEGIRSERHVCIRPFTPLKFIEYILNSSGPPLGTRSLLWYTLHFDIIISEHSFGLLRVLDMANGLMLSKFPMEIVFPPNFKFPAALKKLTLSGCHLRSEDLTMVGSLPNLEVLKLRHYAYDGQGQVWEPNEGEFCELKFLELDLLGLLHWRADDSHFPKLKCLKIGRCFGLKEIPIKIGNIQTLELIELDDASHSAMASAELILDEQRSFSNDVLQVRKKSIWHKDLPE